MAIEDLNGRPLNSEGKTKSDEEAIKEAMKGSKPLQVSRLREGQLLLAFHDTATKRLGAIGYMKQLEAQKMQRAAQGEIGEHPELAAMYQECGRLEAEVMGLVAEINERAQERDAMRASKLGVDLYTDEEFFGRDIKQQPETGKA